MNILKRLFNFNDDDCVIGLCKFNDEFYRQINAKEQAKKRLSKDPSLADILRRSAY